MRILQLSRVIQDHHHGGLAAAATASCRALAANGAEVVMVTSQLPEMIGEEPFERVGIDGTDFRGYHGFFEGSRSAYDQLGKFDMIIAHSKTARDFLVKNRVDIPVVFVCHGNALENLGNIINVAMVKNGHFDDSVKSRIMATYFSQDPEWGVPEYDIFHYHDAIIALTTASAHDFRSRMHCPIVRTLANPEEWHDGGDPNGPIIVCSSSDQIIKGMFYLPELAPGREVVVIGPISASLPSRFKMTGKVSYEKVIEYMQKGSVFVDLSIHHSGHNTTIGQAAACGLPVIGWSTPAIYDGGISAGWDDMKAMNAMIEKVLGEWEYRHQQASEIFSIKYSPVNYSHEIARLYVHLCQSR